MKKKFISVLLPDFNGGGAERAYLEIANEFKHKGYRVEFALLKNNGELINEAKSKFSIFDLNCRRLRNLPKILSAYIQNHQPDILIASMWPLTVIAPISRFLSRQKCKVLICEQNYLSSQYKNKGTFNWILMRASMAIGYRLAHVRLGVSAGVVNDIVKLSGLSKKMFEIIHNPTPNRPIPKKDKIEFAESLWSVPGGARILTVGSFKKQKNHHLLLQAFAKINIPNSRLMFVGNGEERNSLSSLSKKLGINDKIIFAGFHLDPTPFYMTADLFVLSSDYEGFGNVIIESLSCGTPVVSTDCPSGPAEILDNGRFGTLVPVRDTNALANAINIQLNKSVDKQFLIMRAKNYLPEIISNKYLRALNEIG